MPMPSDATLKQIKRRSVKVSDKDTMPTLILIARQADEAPVWWSKARDKYLRKFYPTESYLAGAIYSVCARNAAYRIIFKGPEESVKDAYRLCATADMFKGWENFGLKLSLDLLSQDNGAMFEVIRPARVKTKEGLARAAKMLDSDGNPTWAAIGRKGKLHSLTGTDYKIVDNPLDLPIGINHLDAAFCTRTNDPEYPVIYTDRDGAMHKLRWYQVVTLEDMPSADRTKNDVGYCAVSRSLRLAQTLRDMTMLKQEKVSGRFAGSIWLTNVGSDVIQDAVNEAQENADNRGLTRYMPPIIADTLEPNATPAVAELRLASLPENYNEDEALRWYIAGLALDLGVDYGFLAPLPGNKLGTSQQAEVAERQSRGKASRLWMNTMESKFNFGGLLPRDVWMEFAEVDHMEEMERDAARQRRAITRRQRIESMEITPEVARQIARDDGDLTDKYLAMMAEQDVTPEGVYDPQTGRPQTGMTMGFGKQPANTAVALPEPTEKAKKWFVTALWDKVFGERDAD